MFSSQKHLNRRTPAQGIDRREYIGHLVDEYYTTTNVEAQEQVTANLANFAYDPINWSHLHAADALDVFVASLETPNQNLQLHGIAALCNICLDNKVSEFLKDQLDTVIGLFLRTDHTEIVIHSLTLFYQLLNAGLVEKTQLLTPALLKCVQEWRLKSQDKRIVNLCLLYLKDFGRRTEIVRLKNVTATNKPSSDSPPATGSSS